MKERPYFRELEKRRRRIIQTKRVGPETTVSEASCAVWADCPEPEIERLHCPETYKSTGQFVPSPKGSEAIENKGDWPVDA